MFDKQKQKYKRLSVLIGILSKYGFREVLLQMRLSAPEIDVTTQTKESVYVRIRKALEELGPTFIKLGQAFSNRDDILPKELTFELQKLQDSTAFLDLDIHEILKHEIGENYQVFFQSIETQPLASASIAQIYEAQLKDGEKVVLKVKRPNIEKEIYGDLLLMKDLAYTLETYFEAAENINLFDNVCAFEKSLLHELSLTHERENIERTAYNFRNNSAIRIPKVYPHLSNNDILCMEMMQGAKITDLAFIDAHHLSHKEVAEKGLHLYLEQVLEHGFFHADPHAGNLMIQEDGTLVMIDFGAMGTLYAKDKEQIESLIMYLMTKNTAKLVHLLKKMAVRYDIKDERKLVNDISEILDMVNTNALNDLNLDVLFARFKSILFDNKIIMPDYYTLLVRGVLLLESVGRTVYPQMNLMESIRPYVDKMIAKRFDPKYLWDKGMDKLTDLGSDLVNVPGEVRSIVQKLDDGELKVKASVQEMQETNHLIRRSIQFLIVGMVLCTNIIATAILIYASLQYDSVFLKILIGLSIFLSVLLIFYLLVKTNRRR